MRHIVNWHADARRTYTARDITVDVAWRRGFAKLARHGLSFDLRRYPAQMPGLVDLLRRHPGVPVMVNRLGMPVLDDPDGLQDCWVSMQALADLPHVSVKITGLGFAVRPWRVEDARPLILDAIGLFGPKRCMVAIDFPTDRLFGSFDATFGAYAEIISDFAADERRVMWSGDAERICRLTIGQR